MVVFSVFDRTVITRANVSRFVFGVFLVLLGSAGFAETSHALSFPDLFGLSAGNDLSSVSENIVESTSLLPGLLTALSYLLALLFGVTGILKLKDHVENPNQTALRVPIARFFIGGALLALPIVYEAMSVAINGGENVNFDAGIFTVGGALSNISGLISNLLGTLGITEDINYIFASIISSVRFVPALITAVAYLLGLLFGVIGLLKLKDHIESPEQNPLKEGVIRLLIGGALFALPNVYEAMQVTIAGGGGFTIGGVLSLFTDIDKVMNDDAACNSISGLFGGGSETENSSLGSVMCNLVTHTGAFSAFLAAISYLFGLVLGLWGILKIQDHVLNPQQTPIWDGISRFIAAGAFFSLPFVIEVFQNTVSPESLSHKAFSVMGVFNKIKSLFGGGGGGGGATRGVCDGLDGAITCFVTDIFAPLATVVNIFSMFAGMVLIMIGISRLMKSAQEGARGPGGLGTMMTFLTGGALISYTEILSAFSVSFFNSSDTLSFGVLKYTEGMSTDEVAHANIVISAILKFMILVGLISFVRGIFIVRNVAEGNQQASLMAGITHMVGGVLAVNLGPLISAVQTTLGITEYGIGFSI